MAEDNRAKSALLPEGLRDDLPPWAEYEARMVDKLMAVAASHGYRRVAPPLVEFEDSLSAHSNQAQSETMFRVLDPVSQRMMAVRSDMTMQVARIATSRLADKARPLRLSYAGHVLRVKGSQLRPARQFRQAGVELIGSDAGEADLEVILLAAEALEDLGIKGLSVDLVAPRLVPELCKELGLDHAQTERARHALDTKDAAALGGFNPETAEILRALMQSAGSAERAINRLKALPLNAVPNALCERLITLAEALLTRAGDLAVTIDPGEVRGFEFQTGIGFAFFARDVRVELGRGGRYCVGGGSGKDEESAVGFSMYLDSLLRAVEGPGLEPLIFVPAGAESAEVAHLRKVGWRTVCAFETVADPKQAAAEQACTHYYENGLAVPVGNGEPIDLKGRHNG